MVIEHDISLLPYNTFAVDCIAKEFCVISSAEECQLLIQKKILTRDKSYLIIWWWSNILLLSQQFEGLVIKNAILGKTIDEKTTTHATITCWAWENRNDFVLWTIDQWFCGLENLISIPWSVGAAPMQNIGAYWIEVWTYIKHVEYLDIDTWVSHIITADECLFWYRNSIFKNDLQGQVIITSVTFTLPIYDQAYTPTLSYWVIKDRLAGQEITPKNIADTIAGVRAEKLPDWTTLWTAWSFFKNPIMPESKANSVLEKHPDLVTYPSWTWMIKFSAGQLIDRAWLKWIQQWSVGTYNNHALVLVNHWWWTWKDIAALATYIHNTVKEKYGISLESEVNYIS